MAWNNTHDTLWMQMNSNGKFTGNASNVNKSILPKITYLRHFDSTSTGSATHCPCQWHSPNKRVKIPSSISIVHDRLFYFCLHDDHCCHLSSIAAPFPPFYYCCLQFNSSIMFWCAQSPGISSVQTSWHNHRTDWNEIQTKTVPQFTNSRTITRVETFG